MSWQIKKQRFLYHWKRYMAILFSVIGCALLLSDGVYSVILQMTGASNTIDFWGIWNFVILAIAYGFILIGNVQGTVAAINGLLMFVFMTTFLFGEYLIVYNISDIGALFSGSLAISLIFIFALFFFVLGLVSGIMTYIRTRQYLLGRYSNYEAVRNWCLVFTICSVIANGLLPALILLNPYSSTGVSADVVMTLLEPLSEVAISIACFFTVTRLHAEF